MRPLKTKIQKPVRILGNTLFREKYHLRKKIHIKLCQVRYNHSTNQSVRDAFVLSVQSYPGQTHEVVHKSMEK